MQTSVIRFVGGSESHAVETQAEPRVVELEGGSATLEGSVVDALRTIHDPEIPVNIYDLGLIYLVHIDAHSVVNVQMTLTAPACPVAGTLPRQVENVLRGVKGVSDAHVELVWDPPWSQECMSEEAKLTLGLL